VATLDRVTNYYFSWHSFASQLLAAGYVVIDTAPGKDEQGMPQITYVLA
jgi:hypothetical protein